ncbi:choice-of-anchor tandem repeat GloVer-containing protein [Verrucomicrobiota bacterium sgz303538]
MSNLGGFHTRHEFAGTASDGAHPVSLILAKDGNLYGSTRAGGSNNAGALFKITLPGFAGGAYSLLHSFDGSTGGQQPMGSLVEGVDGSIYGVTVTGGEYGNGTVFRMSSAGSVTVLHSFGAGLAEGAESIVHPMTLMQASDGNFYGLAADTVRPGVNEFVGTLRRALFKMSPDGDVTVVGRFSVPAIRVITGGTPDTSAIVESAGGGIYFVSDDELYQYDLGEERLAVVELPAGLSNPGNLLRSRSGNIYGTASTNSGAALIKIASTDGTVTQLPGTLADLPLPVLVPAPQVVLLPPAGVPTSLTEGANGTLYGAWTRDGGSYFFSIKPELLAGVDILYRLPDSPTTYRSLVADTFGFIYGLTNGSVFGATFSYTPSAVINQLPVAVDDQFQSVLSTSDAPGAAPTRTLTANVLANDSDPDNEPLSVINVTSTAGSVVEASANGAIKVIQSERLNESVHVNYTVMDARGATASATVVFHYTAPVARDDVFRLGPAARETLIDVGSNDTVADPGSLRITKCSRAKYGRVRISEDGKSLKYKPGPLYRGGDSFEYTISDGIGATATAKVRIENPFVGVKGEYYGLINRPQAVGSVRLLMSPTGAFTGALYYGGQVVRFRGQLSTDGWREIPISIKGAGRMTLNVSAMRGQAPRIDAVVEMNDSGIYRVVFNAAPSRIAATTPNQIAGKYTVALPADPTQQGTYYPQGDGFALLEVGANGAAKLVGRLGDGTAFSAGTLLLADGSLPFYLDAYTKRVGASGGISGKLRFANTEESDVSGELVWIKPKQIGGAYAGGFRGKISAVGSRWTPSSQVVSPDQFWRKGAMLHMGEGDLPDEIKKRVEISAGTDLVLSPLGADQMQLQMDPVTGFFGGKFVHPETRTTHPIQGVILQKQRSAAGVFAGQSMTGWVLIESRE